MTKLSVVIITFNEERNIGRCLESVRDIADDIVIVDSFSTDGTEAICRKYPVNFVRHTWEGYSRSKNFANSMAKFDWVLSLDADEALSEKLAQTIMGWKKLPEGKPAEFNRLTNYCGNWVRHGGWYPDTKTRIFNRQHTQWQGDIHEKLHSPTRITPLHLAGDCYHYSYYSIDEHLRQADKFTTIAAQELYSNHKSASPIRLYLSPAVKFLRDYFFNLGFLDGKTGFTVARISAYATHMKYRKLRELHTAGKS